MLIKLTILVRNKNNMFPFPPKFNSRCETSSLGIQDLPRRTMKLLFYFFDRRTMKLFKTLTS